MALNLVYRVVICTYHICWMSCFDLFLACNVEGVGQCFLFTTQFT